MAKVNCFYVPGKAHIIDEAVQRASGEWVSLCRGLNLMMLRDEQPEVVMGDLDEWIEQHEQSLISAPIEITKTQWWDALECLPPEDWQQGLGGESFKMMEYYSGNITTIYVRLGKRYFCYHDRASLPHTDCLAKVQGTLVRPK